MQRAGHQHGRHNAFAAVPERTLHQQDKGSMDVNGNQLGMFKHVEWKHLTETFVVGLGIGASDDRPIRQKQQEGAAAAKAHRHAVVQDQRHVARNDSQLKDQKR